MRIRANHTLPIGLIDLTSFIDSLGMDVMTKRIRKLSTTTGWVHIDCLNSAMFGKRSPGTGFDPFVVVILNGKIVGQTHTLSHTDSDAAWHERVTYPAELLKNGNNIFRFEVYDKEMFVSDDLIGSVTLSFEGGPRAITTEVRLEPYQAEPRNLALL